VTMLEQTRSRMTEEEPPAQKVVRGILDKIPENTSGAARMLPPECYTSPEFFEFERNKVFAHSWICVGRIEQVANPGDCISAQPAGEPVLVTRTPAGEIRAMTAICRHRGQIIPCAGNQKTLRCPLHFWTYDLEGRLIGAPHMGREETIELRKSARLTPVKVELWHGFIFVNLDPLAEPLAPTKMQILSAYPRRLRTRPFHGTGKSTSRILLTPTIPSLFTAAPMILRRA
jgi:phenylpropionate dioxygenase-like ring-hydroxylating dioxygenase large terminal subunit